MMNLVNMMIEAYIKVMGEAKWNSLTEKEQHDAIMEMISDSMKAIEKIEK